MKFKQGGNAYLYSFHFSIPHMSLSTVIKKKKNTVLIYHIYLIQYIYKMQFGFKVI